MFLTLRLQAPPIFTGRLTEVLGAVAAEIAQRGEVHAVGDLGEREALIIQKTFQDGHGGTIDITADAVARHAFDCGGEVLRRDVQPLGIVAYFTLGATDAGGEQVGQLTDDIGRSVAMDVGGITLCMRLEDVIHHRQAETSHQFVIEQQMTVAHAVAETVEVGEHDSCLLISEFDDGILVEGDASSDAVVIRRQQVLQKLIVGCKPLHLQIRMGGEVICAGRIWHHHQIVFFNLVAFRVKYKAAFAFRAEQMHTSVTQSRVIHPEEIRSVLKINLHGAKIRIISLVSAKYCGNCENNDAFCETNNPLSCCIFAS